ncbi:MAG: hypothetical protein H0Z24_03160 [Thermosipho sp. (in: Bacteria)]|nr:hypothetical protein [Thermosipho sp. (in: thermotogales)]
MSFLAMYLKAAALGVVIVFALCIVLIVVFYPFLDRAQQAQVREALNPKRIWQEVWEEVMKEAQK